MTLTSQKKARKKWNENNREHRNYLIKRSTTRSFIRNLATGLDLNELEVLIAERWDALTTDTEREIKKVIEDVYCEELKEQSWEEAFNNAMLLKDFIKDESLQDLTGRELSQYHIPDIETELKKYWYFNGEMRKAVGALRKKGQKFVDFAN